jgi:hypothetical protein
MMIPQRLLTLFTWDELEVMNLCLARCNAEIIGRFLYAANPRSM